MVDGQWISQAKELEKSCTACIPKKGYKGMKRDEPLRKISCVGLRMCRLGIEVPSSRLACERARGGGCNPYFSPPILFFLFFWANDCQRHSDTRHSFMFQRLACTLTGTGWPLRRPNTRSYSHTPSRSHQLIPIITIKTRHLTSQPAHTHSLDTRSSPRMQCQVPIKPPVLPAPSIAKAGQSRHTFKTRTESLAVCHSRSKTQTD